MDTGTENRIFVGNIPSGATAEDLISHFAQFGTTSDVYLPRIYGTKQHKGIAYVTFDHVEAKEMALSNSSHTILGTPVDLQLCLPKGAGKSAGKGAMPGTTASGERIFISQIPQDATQDEVQAYFAQFGGWTDVFMPKGSFTAGHKGICFISFTNPTSAEQVMETAPHFIGATQVVVDMAAPRIESGGGKGPHVVLPQHAFHAFVPVPGVPVPTRAPGYAPPGAPVVVWPPWQGAAGVVGQVLPGRLFLTKMSPMITKDDLTGYFEQFGALNDVFIPSGNKGIAFIGFDDPSTASAVAHMGSHEVKNGCLVNVDMAVDRPPLSGKGMGKPTRSQPY